MAELSNNYDVAKLLAELMLNDPKLFGLLKETMQDPRQNHIIKEEEEVTDL